MIVPFNNLRLQYLKFKEEYERAVLDVLNSGLYILGEKVEEFEVKFANFVGVKYCVGVNSGLDALLLAIRALGITEGDEVIVPANTYIASVLGVTENRAIPIFVEPDDFYNIDPSKIENAITCKTKAIMAVHLYGQPASMRHILELAKKYNLYIIEDCAQAHGAMYKGKNVGTFGDVGCFSFYPTKNLGAFGDGGAVVTNNSKVVKKIKLLRNYGCAKKYYHEIEGINSRLDEIQAALLNVKLEHLNELIEERQKIANRYLKMIKNSLIQLPKIQNEVKHTWHLFVVRCKWRNMLIEFLKKNGISTQIHYPIPPHLSKAYSRLGYKRGSFPITEGFADTVVSIPLYNGMEDNEILYVIDRLNAFNGK